MGAGHVQLSLAGARPDAASCLGRLVQGRACLALTAPALLRRPAGRAALCWGEAFALVTLHPNGGQYLCRHPVPVPGTGKCLAFTLVRSCFPCRAAGPFSPGPPGCLLRVGKSSWEGRAFPPDPAASSPRWWRLDSLWGVRPATLRPGPLCVPSLPPWFGRPGRGSGPWRGADPSKSLTFPSITSFWTLLSSGGGSFSTCLARRPGVFRVFRVSRLACICSQYSRPTSPQYHRSSPFGEVTSPFGEVKSPKIIYENRPACIFRSYLL